MAAVMSNRGAWMMACAVGLALAGCASAPKPTTVTGSIEAVAQLNPSAARRPSPMLLRIYELKTAAAFSGADFMSLYQSDQATLGAELVAREEVMLKPSETRPYAKTLAPDTRFIGVLGAFRDVERATWRAVVPVQPGKAQKLTIKAGELAITATVSQ